MATEENQELLASVSNGTIEGNARSGACPGHKKGQKMSKEHLKVLTLTGIALILFLAVSCNSPVEPDPGTNPSGNVVAWFNGLSYTIDLYFPESDLLVATAYITGEVPNDILSHEDGYIAVLNSTSANVQVFDLKSTGGELFHIDLPAGSNPYTMSWDGDNLWVTLLLNSQIARVDLTQGGTVTLFDVPEYPSGIASTGTLVLVGHGYYESGTGGITILDAVSGVMIGTLDTPENTWCLKYFSETGLVHAMSTTYNGDGMISIINPANNTILSQIAIGESPGKPVQVGSYFASGDGWLSEEVFFYNETGTLLDTWNTGFNAIGLAVSGDTLYITDFGVDKVYIANWSSKTLLDSLSAGNGPQGIIVADR